MLSSIRDLIAELVSSVGPVAKCQDHGFDPVVVHIKVVVTESVGNWARSQRVSGSSPGCGAKLERVLTEVPRHLQNASTLRLNKFSDPQIVCWYKTARFLCVKRRKNSNNLQQLLD